jgi:hypothetical protein
MKGHKVVLRGMLVLAIVSFGAAAAFGQDAIVMENGNPGGFAVLQSDIFRMKYENGNRVLFSEVATNTSDGYQDFRWAGDTSAEKRFPLQAHLWQRAQRSAA